jgi:hypothetical protein
MFTVSTSTGPSLLANISSQLTDPGTLVVLAIAAGVPLAFYVIKRLIGILPKGK